MPVGNIRWPFAQNAFYAGYTRVEKSTTNIATRIYHERIIRILKNAIRPQREWIWDLCETAATVISGQLTVTLRCYCSLRIWNVSRRCVTRENHNNHRCIILLHNKLDGHVEVAIRRAVCKSPKSHTVSLDVNFNFG